MKPLHSLTQSFFREVKDMHSNSLPSRIPPLRGIEHQIDILLGAPLSNKPTYRYNPNDSKELQEKSKNCLTVLSSRTV